MWRLRRLTEAESLPLTADVSMLKALAASVEKVIILQSTAHEICEFFHGVLTAFEGVSCTVSPTLLMT